MTISIYHVDNMPTPRLAAPLDGVTPKHAGRKTAAEMIEGAALNWRVLEQKLMTETGLKIHNHKALVREDNKDVLGVVGSGFEVLQNAEAFAFCDSLVSAGKVEYLSAGQLNGGKRIFIQCRLNEGDGGAEIAPGDVVAPYFVLANGHDGSLAVRALLTPIRIVCQNTFRMALSKKANGEDSISIKHTRNMQERLELSKELFGWADEGFGEFVMMARETVKRKITTEQKLRAFFRETFKVEEADMLEKEGNAKLKNREERLSELFMDGVGQDNKAIKGSAWAAVNAVTQYLDHEVNTALRGIDTKNMAPDERTRLTKLKRFESNTFGGNARIKQRALELALTV